MAAARLRRSATAKLDSAPIPHRRGNAAAIFNLPQPPPNGRKKKTGRGGYEAHGPPAASLATRGGVHQALRRPGSRSPPDSRCPAAEARKAWGENKGRPQPPAAPRAYPLAVVLLAAVAHDSGWLSPLLAWTEAVRLLPSLRRPCRSLSRRRTLRTAQGRRAPHLRRAALLPPDVTRRSLSGPRSLPRRRAFPAPPTPRGWPIACSGRGASHTGCDV